MQEQTNPLGLNPSHICIVCGKSHIWNPLWNGNGECDCGSTLIFTKNDSEKLIPNKLLLITGGTGSGKNHIVEKLNGFFKNIPSITDRLKRDDEVPGEDYKFITTESFKEIEELGFLIESVKFGENLYGVESIELLDKLYNEETEGILIVEPGGLIQVLKWLIDNHRLIPSLEIDQVFLDFSRTERFQNIYNAIASLNSSSNLNTNQIQEIALKRLVRNGDSIPDDYKNKNGEIENLIIKLRSWGVKVNRNEICTKETMNKYIDSLKLNGEIISAIDKMIDKSIELKFPFDELLAQIEARFHDKKEQMKI